MLNLKDQLKRGDIQKIAEATGYHVDTVSKTVNGHETNETVLKAAVALVRKRNATLRKLAQTTQTMGVAA